MKDKSRAAIAELIENGKEFRGYTIYEMRAALEDALDQPDVVQCKNCKYHFSMECPYADACFNTPDDCYCEFGDEKDE